MSIDELARHKMYLRLEEVLGAEEADVLMAHLPPVGFADVATQRDLEQLETRLEATEQRLLATLHAELGSKRGRWQHRRGPSSSR